jgi:hypothetical protein
LLAGTKAIQNFVRYILAAAYELVDNPSEEGRRFVLAPSKVAVIIDAGNILALNSLAKRFDVFDDGGKKNRFSCSRNPI